MKGDLPPKGGGGGGGNIEIYLLSYVLFDIVPLSSSLVSL